MTRPASLSLWSVYDHPRDYPSKWVARRWEAASPAPIRTDDVLLADTLDELRAKLPRGLYCLPRERDDDPAIYETWF